MTYYLYILGLILFPLGNLLRFQIAGDISIVVLDFVVAFIGLSLLPSLWRKRHELRKNKIFQAACAFISIGLISLIWNAQWLQPQQFIISGLYMARFVAYSLLIWIPLTCATEQRQKLFIYALISGGFVVLGGITQYLLYPDLRNLFYLGWDKHYNRLYGTFFDPNFLGAYLVLYLGILYKAKLLYRNHTTPIVIMSVITLGALFLTYSRSSYLMLLIAALTYSVIKQNYKIIGIGILSLMIGLIIIPKNTGGEGVNLLRTSSIERRLEQYEIAKDIALENPILGVGFNAYRYAQIRHGYIDTESWIQDHAGAGVPNSYLFVLATTGFAGLIVFLLLWGTLIWKALKSNANILFAISIGLVVHALFENSLFYPFILFPLFPQFYLALSDK